MRRLFRFVRLLIPTALLGVAAPALALAPVGPHLERRLADDRQPGPLAIWVDFTPAIAPPPASESVVSERSLKRRRDRGSMPTLVDASDQPLPQSQIEAVASRVLRLRTQSRWLGAASAEATPAQIAALRGLTQVASVELVARATRRADDVPAPQPLGPGYGDSADQLHLIRVDALHDRGLTGLGVLVAHFDTGYYSLRHEVFRTMRIAAAYDFVDRDTDVTDGVSNPDDALDHGQFTLSVLAGFKPGKLVGVAPGATYLLARTESSANEVAAEEDYWIAALEWADSLGADVVSSSLKFLNYDEPGTGYEWTDMDGTTPRVTRAAELAVRRGMLIVNGAGNEGANDIRNTLVAPADGVNVLAVGAVNRAGTRANFSSVGPTADDPPRIKPDVMALGVEVVAADILTDSSYTRVSGTSLSTPLTAGVAALLLSVHDATPLQIMDVLRSTATRAGNPDTRYGWGVIDALAAWEHLIALFPTDADAAARWGVELRYPNPFRPASRIDWGRASGEAMRLRIYDAMGRQVREWRPTASSTRLDWDGDDAGGRQLPNGVYFLELQSDSNPRPSTRGKLTLLR